MKEYGLTLNHQSRISSRTICQRKSSIFFDTIRSSIENKMEQFNSTKSNSICGTIILKYKIGPMIDGWLVWLQTEDPKRRYQHCFDYFGSITHLGSNLIDPTLQDNVLIGPGIFPYIYHVGSNFNLHSIVGNGLRPGGQNLSRRQSVFFLPVDPRKEDHKDPEFIDNSVPRHAQYVQNTRKRHQDTVFWIDIDLGIINEGLKFYQTRSNAIILQRTLPTHCIRNGEATVRIDTIDKCEMR